MIYAYSSGTGNNGSAFAGLNANTPFYNTTIGIDAVRALPGSAEARHRWHGCMRKRLAVLWGLASIACLVS